VSPHIPSGTQWIVTERGVAPPRSRRSIRITTGTRVEKSDHTELRRLAESRLACDVRIRVVGGPLHPIALTSVPGVRVAHRAFFALGSRTRTAFPVVGVRLRDLLGLDGLLLFFGSG